MSEPSELSLSEIRNFMLANGCKVTNHALVKHFKKFLTNVETQNEARKQFKTYVNILATIKPEKNEKFLILRKKYMNECPSEDLANRTEPPLSPGASSIISDVGCSPSPSPLRQPPPYKPPPDVVISSTSSSNAVKLPVLQQETKENYRDCINEFEAAVNKIDSNRLCNKNNTKTDDNNESSVVINNANNNNCEKVSSENDNKENIVENNDNNKISDVDDSGKNEVGDENTVSVKEAAKRFNRLASEEEAKIVLSPTNKKKENASNEDKVTPEVTMSHPKAKEWVVSSAKASYQELAKLAQEHPELAKLQDPLGYTALHWAAKHGNEDVVKLIAGTYHADVNARTNGGYTPLHIAMQFGRDNIFELLCNVYKADRDISDWSGNKPLDYRKQQTTVSASTYSKIKERRKHSEKDLGFLRIGSLNVRVRKTTEAFSNFLGVGGGNTNNSNTSMATTNHHHRHHHHRHYPRHQQRSGTMMKINPTMTTNNKTNNNNKNNNTHHHHHHHHHQHTQNALNQRTSMPTTNNNNNHNFDKIHKSWGSADNIPHDRECMPPPNNIIGYHHKKGKTSSSKLLNNNNDFDDPVVGYSSMPTTPNQIRAPIGGILNENKCADSASLLIDSDSDSACGFGSNWSVEQQRSQNINSDQQNAPTYI